MNYHISTTLIWDNYKKQGECPLCDIYRDVELRILEQFAGEAVMIDDFRDRVNKKGFCKKHFEMLSKGENKLGIALQTHTRLKNIKSGMSTVKNAKLAIKEAERIQAQLCTCAVCDLIEDAMQRYYETIAKMYYNESEFQRHFNTGKGYCMYHYSELLKNSHKAKGEQEGFLKNLQEIQASAMDRLLAELDWFCDKFDYRNREKPMGSSKDALPRSICKIHGER